MTGIQIACFVIIAIWVILALTWVALALNVKYRGTLILCNISIAMCITVVLLLIFNTINLIQQYSQWRIGMAWQEILLFIFVLLAFLSLYTFVVICILYGNNRELHPQPHIEHIIVAIGILGFVFITLTVGVKALWLSNLI